MEEPMFHPIAHRCSHAGLFDLFLDVRNAAAAILDHTSLQDLVERNRRILLRRGRPLKERR
jgi:DNA-binding IscR family transcriptional regulator